MHISIIFYSSPAVALADSAVFTLLGEENQDKYGSQRMFGSIGWAVTMLVLNYKFCLTKSIFLLSV